MSAQFAQCYTTTRQNLANVYSVWVSMFYLQARTVLWLCKSQFVDLLLLLLRGGWEWDDVPRLALPRVQFSPPLFRHFKEMTAKDEDERTDGADAADADSTLMMKVVGISHSRLFQSGNLCRSRDRPCAALLPAKSSIEEVTSARPALFGSFSSTSSPLPLRKKSHRPCYKTWASTSTAS